jgi:hypothetical protein
MMIVKILREKDNSPLYLNTDHVIAVAVNGIVEILYVGERIDANERHKIALTKDEAQPLIDVLEMCVAETTARKKGYSNNETR